MDKIAAIGVRVRQWVSYHGVALNVEPELEHFAGIVLRADDLLQLTVSKVADAGKGMDTTSSTLEVKFREPVQVDAGGGKISLSTPVIGSSTRSPRERISANSVTRLMV